MAEVRKADWGANGAQASRYTHRLERSLTVCFLNLYHLTRGNLLVSGSISERGPGPIPSTVTVPAGISV